MTDADKLARYADLANLVEELHDDNMMLRQQVADAARYRWLRDNKATNNTHCWHFQNGPIIPGLTSLDAAIDGAIEKAKVPE